MIARKHRVLVFLILLAVCGAGDRAIGQGPSRHGLLVDYYPVVCHPALYPNPSCALEVFKEGKLRQSVELPLRMEIFDYTHAGNFLYDVSVLEHPGCFYKVDLNPVGVESLGCRDGLTAFSLDVANRGDSLLVSGVLKGGAVGHCGIFELRVPGLASRQVVDAGDCSSYRFEDAWTSLSLSPDGRQAVAVRRNRLDLIDVGRGTTRILGEGFEKASWSPDGGWIAALGVKAKTELIDTADFKVRRTLAESEVQWSPDSRYLLRVRPCFFPIASNGVGTIEALEIATGKSVLIESSRCAVDNHSTGWVSGEVLK
jgi:hypothetical protein